MKKATFVFVLILALVLPTSAFASTYYSVGASSPQTVQVYGTNQWSNTGTWDLTNDSNIPDGATIDLISEAWNLCYSCGMNSSSTHVAFVDSNSLGIYLQSGIYYNNFQGENAKQVWSTFFYVTNTLVGAYGYITPVLYIYWNDPVTGAAGRTTLNSNGTTTTQKTTSSNLNIQTSTQKYKLLDAKPFKK